ncbi:hypothetical protein LWI29_032097 [Acer saccharum]|uniref:Transposase MuDR plant domain-containing protein n=1 Tax=Acer saccharum TaxID=4024 RepID=A0AA39SFQ3_ACESA|nr:hypothetical protein LWI29_032097 [Acer saccharum]KAK1564329.1 hypothetical protein Q3G72_000725 [Acer saccharum]
MGDKVIQYQHPEAHNDRAEADGVVNGPDVVGLNEERVDELNGEATERDKLQRKEKGKQVAKDLDRFDTEEVERGPVRRFLKKRYHEFNPSHDMQDPKFMLSMEFGSTDAFKNAIRAHAMKNRRDVTFKKNDPNRIRAVCVNEGFKWFVYGSWLSDKRTFKIKSLGDKHTCAMSFKNKFVNSKMIVDKYVDQWRVNPNWNFVEMSHQLRVDTSVDVSVWQYYRARKKAKRMI